MRLPTSLLVVALLHAATASAGVPPELAAAALEGGMSREEVQQAATEPVALIYEAESKGRQITVLGLAMIPASPEKIAADLLKRNGLLKSEALRQIGVFSNPPKMSDLAEYRMPESDLETLADCELGDCKFKLGKEGVATAQQIDWSEPDAYDRVNDLMKQGMLELAQDYQERGSEALVVARDKEEPQSFAEGSARLTAQLGLSKELVPTLRDHLLHYPKAEIPGARDRILWMVRDYGYRPLTSLVHSIIHQPEQGPPAALIALKTLYANHYFHARQRLIGLWADSEDPNATWIGYSDRLLFDGDVGSIKRRMLQAGILKSGTQRLKVLRAQYE
jgi:hypothetical protein